MKRLAFALVALLVLPMSARAATLTFGTLTVNVPAASATCTLPTNLVAPVAANTTICTITVSPSNWVGVIANPTGGADSAKFAVVAVSGQSVLQNVVALTATGSAAGNNVYAIGSSAVTP